MVDLANHAVKGGLTVGYSVRVDAIPTPPSTSTGRDGGGTRVLPDVLHDIHVSEAFPDV